MREFPGQPILHHEVDILAGFGGEVAKSKQAEIAITQRRRKPHSIDPFAGKSASLHEFGLAVAGVSSIGPTPLGSDDLLYFAATAKSNVFPGQAKMLVSQGEFDYKKPSCRIKRKNGPQPIAAKENIR
jgi:hypothetical protein